MSYWDETARYVVVGRGEFPLDMLRRDMSWPTTTADAVNIQKDERRAINLTAHQLRYVNVERWASFGWRVIELVDSHGRNHIFEAEAA